MAYVQVAAGGNHAVLHRSDSSAVAGGLNYARHCDLLALAAGLTCAQDAFRRNHTLLPRSDGSAMACGNNRKGQGHLIALPAGLTYAQVTAGGNHTVLLRSDGDAVSPPAGAHTVLLRSDGSAVACSCSDDGECDLPALAAALTYAQCDIPVLTADLTYNVHFGPAPLQESLDGDTMRLVTSSGAVTVSGFDEFFLSKSTEVLHTMIAGGAEFQSPDAAAPVDCPGDPMNLSPEQKNVAVTILFKDTSTFDFGLEVLGDEATPIRSSSSALKHKPKPKDPQMEVQTTLRNSGKKSALLAKASDAAIRAEQDLANAQKLCEKATVEQVKAQGEREEAAKVLPAMVQAPRQHAAPPAGDTSDGKCIIFAVDDQLISDLAEFDDTQQKVRAIRSNPAEMFRGDRGPTAKGENGVCRKAEQLTDLGSRPHPRRHLRRLLLPLLHLLLPLSQAIPLLDQQAPASPQPAGSGQSLSDPAVASKLFFANIFDWGPVIQGFMTGQAKELDQLPFSQARSAATVHCDNDVEAARQQAGFVNDDIVKKRD
ncbi:unnamed protein product [Prorocentrum cordatum]|uniref:Altered inheritance of mitochondria protein 24, mitochondrial n=1 Tax=Prorocentrum cordatum TaxID=2364126 RepID=A0ABN9SG38_9DINO|nr:unnamed protein product [Polarella glacialis]